MKDQRVPWEVEGAKDAPSEPALEYETRGKQKRGLLCACAALASTPYLMHISITLSLESSHLGATAIDCKFQIEQPRVNTRTNVANNMPCGVWTVYAQYPKASPETSGPVREVGRRVIDSQKEAGSAGSKGLDKMQSLLPLTGAALAYPGKLWNTQVQASDNRGRRSCQAMRMFICSLGLPDILRLRGGAELALEPAKGGPGVMELPSRQPLSLSASLDSGTLLASDPYATPRELKNLPCSQLLQATYFCLPPKWPNLKAGPMDLGNLFK